ncbi:hypothetical protein P0W64_19915 [Tsukamurella sp. 8F]|uniref:hypothetical protein n=1 Tax=unclassified Tsukamurella TaxID=2633480 RepID=UPI0023B94C3B|nr:MULTISPECIES: hypothetical protein [unclassified Tsukamurella]MDF0531813.1 hypothetical protein [Tsukamurella sp. 8J]MDF0589055.1 hypothetical protein [Tsukamurella sp. 8F]
MTDLANRLLDAHVAYEREQLRGNAFHSLILEEVENALDTASQITLGEAVTPEMIKAVARKYAAQVPVEGAIPELVGEIASVLYRHRTNDDNALSDVFDARSFDELASTAADLDVTRRLAERLWTSPVAVDVCATALRHAATAVADDGRAVLDRLPGVRRIGRIRLPATVDQHAEDAVRRAVAYVLEKSATGAAEEPEAAARELWHQHRDTRLGSFRDLVSEDDVEAIVVLVFEFWRVFRETGYFHDALDAGIDYFFEKYSDTSLYEILNEVGVGREDMIEEALRFGPPVFEMLDERGFLEPLIRRRLAAFYTSDAFRVAAEQ